MPIVATVELDWLDMAVLLQSALPAPLAGELGSTAGLFHYRPPLPILAHTLLAPQKSGLLACGTAAFFPG
jgi:hypothetical protein